MPAWPLALVRQMTPWRTTPFAHNLRAAIAADGRSMGELADRLGIPVRRLRRLANGEIRPTLDDVPAIAAALRVRPELLAWGPA